MGVKLAIAVALATAATASPALARPGKGAETACTGNVIAARQHQGTFNGRKVTYDSCVERYDTLDAAGQPAARITAISYVARRGTADRPVLFVFNGGPIVASYILHLGAFGPKRLAVPDDISVSPDQFQLVDNPHSPLDVADVVFFDPAGTGLSELAPGVAPGTGPDRGCFRPGGGRWFAARGSRRSAGGGPGFRGGLRPFGGVPGRRAAPGPGGSGRKFPKDA